MKKNILILSFSHHYGPTGDYAHDARCFFSSRGFETHVAMMGDSNFSNSLADSINERLEAVLIIGTPPFGLMLESGKFLWEALLEMGIKIITILLDQIPYCLRIPGFKKYLLARKKYDNELLICWEKNIADMLTSYCEKTVLFRQCYANVHPAVDRAQTTRWLFWGSIDAGLASEQEKLTLFDTISANNVWGLSRQKIEDMSQTLIHSNDFFTYTDIANFLQIDLYELLSPDDLSYLCAIDSKLKKERRISLITRLKNFPVDVYGKGWEKYIDDRKTEMKIKQPVPDLNMTFSLLCQKYSGLVNIDPNWSYGTNERVPTALYYGIAVLTNRNYSFMGDANCFQYVLNGSSLENKASKLIGQVSSRRSSHHHLTSHQFYESFFDS
jgi:hypothetical protein